ncbi:hypothetical protein PSH76_16165 [Pseudomonas sp. FP215]|uniref:Uncharacterized protein n=1 Tax=Pseudomonas lactis TaxID=1615674 RepID=A0A921T7G5_9PSED|nr:MULTISPECIES: hypothetical protein [Pseudomonas]WLH21611.1 hypothetical protein PSH76_16165 [Pseudomonas sp. FP215]HJH18824.1 hypothetical protein [Pseudomonas lactis]
MNDSQRAWELAMVLIANGRIPFDPANPSGSVKILSKHLQALEEALREQATATHERLGKNSSRRPSLVCAD